jgi:hypothetical protein
VIRDGDVVKLCFYIALTEANAAKPYAMVPVEVPIEQLQEIANTLLVAADQAGQEVAPNPLLVRLEALENQITALRAALDQATARQRNVSATPEYRRQLALVVGVDEIAGTGFKLRYAESDARAIASALTVRGLRRRC